jgi:sirohydrochlorin cobaltochelatase
MKTALVLAGHGSHISPETAGLVWQHVDALRAMNIADEITAAFWKEMPSFHTVFASLEATDITLVPLFTAQGYFTQTVIPTEMGLTDTITRRDGRTIRYARTLSEHPYLGEVVKQRIEQAMYLLGTSHEQTAVALVGHSTKRNPESRKATEAQAEVVRQSGAASEVVALYLDDTPAIADVYRMTSAPNLIVVPYFLANGSHTTIDVPRELGFDGHDLNKTTTINNRTVYYTQPVGVEDDLLNTIIELAREAGAPLKPPSKGSSWDGFPSHGLDQLQALIGIGSGIIGQLQITADAVRHINDDQPTVTLTEPDALRRKVRENPFRPLATSADLPCGWHVPTNGDLRRVQAIIETVYPGTSGNNLTPPNSLENLLQRQTGRYQEIQQMNESTRTEVVRHVCGKCVRQPMWVSNEVDVKARILKCPEPCDYWLSAALKMMKGGEGS